ncbi:hypothetical protein AX14_011368 [Amanita brunnescens Koide BX004]|nr:hypothetical protein AX14_011368 [Amanita brunnescens Koide BX004]
MVNKISCWTAPNNFNLPIVKIREGDDEPLIEAAEDGFPMDLELAHRVLEGPKQPEVANNPCQWSGQEAISGNDSSVLLYPLYANVALTPRFTLVDPPPAYSRFSSSLELESSVDYLRC